MKIRKMARRFVCAALVIIYLLTTLAAPYAHASLWTERKAALIQRIPIQNEWAGLSTPPAFPSSKKIKISDAVPQEWAASITPFAECVKVHAVNAKAPWVMIIQDAHGVCGAQKNIAGLL